MNVQKVILRTAYACKPVLFKLLPVAWLRKIKARMIRRNLSGLEQLQLVPYEKGRYPEGINLLGGIRAETGLGQSCRLVAEELLSTGLPVSMYNYVQVGNVKQASAG